MINRRWILLCREETREENFQGPLRYLPSSSNNYGCDHSHSFAVSLTNRHQSIVLLTRNRFQLDQCLILSERPDEHYLFIIDSIRFGTDRRIVQMINDRFSTNRSYVVDHQGNVYLVELPWIEQIENSAVQTLPLTRIQSLIVNADPTKAVLQIGILQLQEHQTSLAVILQSQNENRDKVSFSPLHVRLDED